MLIALALWVVCILIGFVLAAAAIVIVFAIRGYIGLREARARSVKDVD